MDSILRSYAMAAKTVSSPREPFHQQLHIKGAAKVLIGKSASTIQIAMITWALKLEMI
jgi:hypothetical protein